MDTKIEYLRQLERDLKAAADEEERQELGPVPGRRRRGRWLPVAAAGVALLLLAGVVGFFSNRSLSPASPVAAGAAISGSPSQRTGYERALPALGSPAPGHQQKLDTGLTQGSAAYDVANQGNASSGTQQPGCPACTQVDLTKIVKDGTMSIVVPKGGFNAGFEAATKVADDLGGFVLSSSISGTTSGTLTIRVPSRKFDDAILGLHRLGKVESETITGQDVTSNFIDLKAHLKILKTDRQVLIGFLARAHTVGDVLNLHSRLDNVQEQIDQYQGRLNVLTNQIAESTIKVSIREEGTKAPETTSVDNPSLGNSWDRGVQGFLRVIGFVVVGLGYLVPIAVIIFLIWIGLRLTRRSRETQPAYSPTATRTESSDK